MLGITVDRLISWEFQSAPGLEAGRCDVLRVFGLPSNGFQSAPGLEAGRCSKTAAELPGIVDVSIRARP